LEDANEAQIAAEEDKIDKYNKLAASIMAVTGQLIKHVFTSNMGGLGEMLMKCVVALYRNCPDYLMAEKLSRRMLMVSVKEMEAASQLFKHDFTHPAWTNLLNYMNVLYEFIFYSPTPKRAPQAPVTPKKKGEREIKMHLNSSGSADAPIVQLLVDLLSNTLKVYTIDRIRDADKDVAAAQKKLKARLELEKDFWTQLHCYFQTLPMYKGAAGAKNVVVALVEAAARRDPSVPKAQLELSLQGLAHAVAIQVSPARVRSPSRGGRSKRAESSGDIGEKPHGFQPVLEVHAEENGSSSAPAQDSQHSDIPVQVEQASVSSPADPQPPAAQ